MRLFRPLSSQMSRSMTCSRSLGTWTSSLSTRVSVSEMGRKKGKVTSTAAESDVDVRAAAVTALKDKLAVSLERLKKDLSNVSAGKASPDLLAKVTVEAHGVREPLTKVAQVAVKDHQ